EGQAQQCVVNTAGALLISGPYPAVPNVIHVGETATITLAQVNNPPRTPPRAVPNCTCDNPKAGRGDADHTYERSAHETVLLTLPGNAFTCPGSTGCLPFPTTFVVQLANVGAGLTFATNWPPGGSSSFILGGIPGSVQFLVAGAAGTTTGGGTARPQVSQSL